MVELEDMKSKGPVEATFWPGIKVGNIHIRLRGVGHCMHGRYKSSSAGTSPLWDVGKA
jgi:hypothetical protein